MSYRSPCASCPFLYLPLPCRVCPFPFDLYLCCKPSVLYLNPAGKIGFSVRPAFYSLLSFTVALSHSGWVGGIGAGSNAIVASANSLSALFHPAFDYFFAPIFAPTSASLTPPTDRHCIICSSVSLVILQPSFHCTQLIIKTQETTCSLQKV
jgi:hypothetical protein